jgi:AraC-like DNA-binding protein
MRLGIPVKGGKKRGVANTYEILTLPTHTALLIPPGTFFPNSSQPYWERPTTPIDSRIFWAHVLPTGLFCHPSATRNAMYGSQTPDIFVPGYQFSSLASMMAEELQSPSPEAHQIAQRILPLFFMMILRGLKHGTRANVTAHTSIPTQDSAIKSSSIIIEQAREFIRKHKHQHFTIEDVAANAYVSSSHLMNLFKSELDTTVMGYALEQRMETARAWLINSEMPVKDIARSLGYSQIPQFTRIFKQINGSSPSDFRRQHRAMKSNDKS